MEHFDYCIVGAGVIGLATAFRLSQQTPTPRILIVEQAAQFGTETSSRNSEVIHAGIYYPEGSLKAGLCAEGRQQLYHFCDRYHVPYRKTGKMIVATTEDETASLDTIQMNAAANGVTLELLNQRECFEKEPCVNATAALWSPETGIIDSHQYMYTLLSLAEQHGVLFSPNTTFRHAVKVSDGFKIDVNTIDGAFSVSCSCLINSAGLYAPTVAAATDGMQKTNIPDIHYCRGHYFSYNGRSPFTTLIYPVPAKNLQGLGIHATLDLGGQCRFGPDARYIQDHDYRFPDGLIPLFAEAIRRYFPDLDESRLTEGYTGIRPKLYAAGEPVRDFMIQGENEHNVPGLINLFGIESPGLTASLAIAGEVMKKIRV